jgi:hypothetical protein
MVRAIEVDPPGDDFGGPAPLSAATSLSIIPGCHPQRDCCQNTQYHQNSPPASICSTHHSAARPARQVSQLDRTANPTTNDIAWPRRRKSGNPSKNTSSPDSSLNVDLVTSIGVGPLRRTMSQYDGNSGQPLRTMSGYVDGYVDSSESSLSSPSRPASRSQVREHVELLSGSWQSENWLYNVQDTAALPGSPRAGSTTAQDGRAGPTGASAEIGRKTRDSPRSSRSGYWTHISGRSQDEDISRTATRTLRQLSDPFPATNARTATGEGQKSQNRVFNFLCGLRRGRNQGDDNDRTNLQSVDTFLDSSGGMKRVQSSHTQLQTESHSSLGAPILSRPSSACSHISLASSIETIKSTLSFEVDLTQSEEPENVASPTLPPPSHFFTYSSLEEDIVNLPSALSQDDLNEGDWEDNVQPGRASSSRSGNRGSVWGARSPIEHMHSQFDHPNTGDNTLLQPISPQPAGSGWGRKTPTHLRTQNIRQSPATPSASSPREVWPTSPLSHYSFELSSSTPSGLGLLTGVASPRCQPLPPSPAAQTFPESPVNRSFRSTDAQSPMRNTDSESSRNTPQHAHASSPHLSATTPELRLIDYDSISHLNVPLPSSPVSSASNSSARRQVQPGHRRSPRLSLYPSLADEDRELLSPSGLDVVFGLPTPELSPIQTPVVIRSPSMDPRSPVPSQMRIPGDIMGLLRAFLHSGHDLAHASFFFLSELSFLVVLRLLRIILEWLPDYQGKR